MEHLRWQIESTLTFRSEAQSPEGSAKQPASAVLTRSKLTHADVWIFPSATWYRIEETSLDERNEAVTYKREFCLSPGYTAIQDYNCRPKGSDRELDVCQIHVIPSFGDPRTSDVNMLQYPADCFWTRSLLAGALPRAWNGIPVIGDGNTILCKSFDRDPSHVKSEANKNALIYEADYQSGHVATIIETNGFTSGALSAYRDIHWVNGRIAAFRFTEESIQAKELKRPRLEMRFTLITRDNDPSAPMLKKGGQVMDYRLCAPVALNDFPDRTCPPKTYVYQTGLKPVSQLKTANEAAFLRMPSKANVTPIWIWIATSVFLLAGLSALATAARKARVN